MPTPCAPSSGREHYRSGGPDDPVAPPCRDQTNKRTDLAGSPVDPSCAAPADVRLKRTESRFASRLNRSFATQSGAERTWRIYVYAPVVPARPAGALALPP